MNTDHHLRPFYIAKMLYQFTDGNNSLTNVEIIERLKKEYNIETTRGTVEQDIEILRKFDLDICIDKSSQKHYSLVSRVLDKEELKLLIDAAESARFITKDKSSALVQKLSSLASQYESSELVRNVDVENRIKTENETLYHVMDAMNEAINQRKKVAFQYFSYDMDKQQTLRDNGNTYFFSPYKMIWSEDHYYVVGYSDKHQGVGNFRIDRIAQRPDILDSDAVEPPADFDINRYLNSMFRMYNGERKMIELVCEKNMMDAMIDKFGKDVNVTEHDDEKFRIIVETAVGKVFYSWIFGFEGKVRIAGPADVREAYRDMVKKECERLAQMI